MAMRIFDKLKYAYHRRLWSYKKQARHAGVTMGNSEEKFIRKVSLDK